MKSIEPMCQTGSQLPPKSETERALDGLHDLVVEIQCACGELESKLISILLPCTAPDENKKPDRVCGTPLVSRIENENDLLADSKLRLYKLLERIDI